MSTIDAKELLRQYVKEAKELLFYWEREYSNPFYDSDVEKAYLDDCKTLVERLSDIQI